MELCAFLISQRADLVSSQKDHRNALHWAARNGHLETCRWLIEAKMEPNKPTKDGTTPWRPELERGLLTVFLTSLKHLINTFFNWSFQDFFSRFPSFRSVFRLHWAVWQGHLELCSFLIEAQADLHAKNRHLSNDRRFKSKNKKKSKEIKVS